MIKIFAKTYQELPVLEYEVNDFIKRNKIIDYVALPAVIGDFLIITLSYEVPE